MDKRSSELTPTEAYEVVARALAKHADETIVGACFRALDNPLANMRATTVAIALCCAADLSPWPPAARITGRDHEALKQRANGLQWTAIYAAARTAQLLELAEQDEAVARVLGVEPEADR